MSNIVDLRVTFFPIFFRSIHFLIPQSFIAFHETIHLFLTYLGFYFIHREVSYSRHAMQISRGIWIQESLAWPLWKHADSRRWSNAGHQNSRCFPKLLAKFRRKRKSGSQTCHALSNVSWNRRNSEICRSHDDKWMVLQWKINLVFISITSELKKFCDAQIKHAHCKAEKTYKSGKHVSKH